ncbi:MAG: Mfa1 fimbrilin C-terminal domain-containing protein [Bacteroidaceae bacterium]|nr:Mfa1 fimbrilin C-terminal domain-containing protein [Bacteroidaceae bacterium]
MRTNKFLFGLMAIGTLFSCTNDGSDFETPVAGQVETSYIAINVNSAYDVTRANGYEDGTDSEKKVNKAIFFFFDNAGSPFNVSSEIGGTGVNYIVKTNLTPAGSNPDNVETITEAVLTIKGNKGTNPSKVVAVLNWDYDKGSIALADLKKELVAEADAVSSTNGFIMSNSVYLSGSEIMDATPITAANISTTENDANSVAVQIYVERIAAKVAVTSEKTDALYDTNIENPLTPGQNYFVKILGWDINTTMSHSNMVKDIDASWTDSALGIVGWNIEAYKRSFWGTSASVGGDVALKKNFSWNSINNNVAAADYCLENTTGENTKVVIKAQISDAAGNAVEIVKFLGDYITIDGLKNQIASALATKYYKVEGSVYTGIQPTDIELVQAGNSGADSYTVTYKLTTTAEAASWAAKNDDASYSNITVDAVNTALGALAGAQIWKSGMAYYFTDIEHLGTVGSAAEFGVVRNHSYVINVTDIIGLGTPVYNGDNDILEPVNPTDSESFISAQINVLSWKLVNNSVVLK